MIGHVYEGSPTTIRDMEKMRTDGVAAQEEFCRIVENTHRLFRCNTNRRQSNGKLSQKNRYSIPRQMIVKLFVDYVYKNPVNYEYRGWKTLERLFNGEIKHTTVMYGYKTISGLINVDKNIRADYDRLRGLLGYND